MIKQHDGYNIKLDKLTIARLETGVDITNLQSAVTLDITEKQSLIRLDDLQGEVFGGAFAVEQLTLGPGNIENAFILNVEHMDLAMILEAQGQEGLSGMGVIDGKIPVYISDDGIRIEQGELLARNPGGEIRYRSGGSANVLQKSGLQMKTLMRSLDNFHYHHLFSTVQFSPQGVLLLNIELKGKNPDIDSGREVHLNLNVEQNILTLLESLRFADNISEVVERRLNK